MYQTHYSSKRHLPAVPHIGTEPKVMWLGNKLHNHTPAPLVLGKVCVMLPLLSSPRSVVSEQNYNVSYSSHNHPVFLRNVSDNTALRIRISQTVEKPNWLF